METNAELARLYQTSPMLDAIVDEQDGRRIRIGDHWLADFASCNYLGFDLDPEIIAAVPRYLARWGTHPSWSRMLASPVLNERIDAELAALLGAEDVLTLPTITHISSSVLPALADQGTVYLDARAHKTIWDGCQVARGHGATVRRFAHDDPEQLEDLLRAGGAEPRVVCTDGINSMTGNPPPLREYLRLAREYDALLYVDDGHGFGVVGERAVDEPCPYGRRGNGVVRHLGESYDHVVLVGGFSKAYSSLLAFVTCPTRLKEVLKVAAPPYLYSGPSPIASLATVLEGFRANAERGDQLRARLWGHARRVLDTLDELGAWTPNATGFPIVQVPLADPADLDQAAAFVFGRGVYTTLAFYPGVPRSEVGFRLQLTAANTDQQVDLLTDVLRDLAARFPLRPADGPRTLVLP
ncbi:MAG TPA: pyridoxal phosphate-dependent aminotransferase family protein [Actinomycetes bacterium]